MSNKLVTALTDLFRWVVFAPLIYLPGMAEEQGFPSSLALYLISVIK